MVLRIFTLISPSQVRHLLRKLFNQKFNMLTSSEQEGLTKCFPQKTSKLQLKWGCTKTLLTPQKTHPAALHLEMQELSGWDLKWLQFITPQQIHCTTQPDGTWQSVTTDLYCSGEIVEMCWIFSKMLSANICFQGVMTQWVWITHKNYEWSVLTFIWPSLLLQQTELNVWHTRMHLKKRQMMIRSC